MNKLYLGSSQLKCNFKMFRVKCRHQKQIEKVKEEVMELMNQYLNRYDGKLINIKQLSQNQLVVYFVTGEEEPHSNWQQYLQNKLHKNFEILPLGIQIGPRPQPR